MYVKSHVDVPSLFRLLGTMKADNGGGAVKVDVQDRADLPKPKEWGPYLRAMSSNGLKENSEAVFAGL